MEHLGLIFVARIEKTHEELQEILALLEAEGLHPLLCDTPVPYFDESAPCGIPNELGDAVEGEYFMLPRDLLQGGTTMIIHASGDSMQGSGIDDGDEVHVLIDAPVHDGDVVLAYLDGKSTIKSFYRDKEGYCWLVPRNKAYDSIKITEDMDARIVGRVVKHFKDTPRTPYSELTDSVERTRQKSKEATKSRYTDTEDMQWMLRKACAGQMVSGSDWIAVYRILVDRCGAPSSYKAFADFINSLALDELPPCTPDSLRKADPIYLRPVYQWTPEMAPAVRVSVLDRRASIARGLRRLLE